MDYTFTRLKLSVDKQIRLSWSVGSDDFAGLETHKDLLFIRQINLNLVIFIKLGFALSPVKEVWSYPGRWGSTLITKSARSYGIFSEEKLKVTSLLLSLREISSWVVNLVATQKKEYLLNVTFVFCYGSLNNGRTLVLQYWKFKT